MGQRYQPGDTAYIGSTTVVVLKVMDTRPAAYRVRHKYGFKADEAQGFTVDARVLRGARLLRSYKAPKDPKPPAFVSSSGQKGTTL